MEKDLLQIFSDILKIDIENLSLDTEKNNIDEWDSLASIRILAEFEEVFRVQVPFEDLGYIEKIRDYLKYLKNKD